MKNSIFYTLLVILFLTSTAAQAQQTNFTDVKAVENVAEELQDMTLLFFNKNNKAVMDCEGRAVDDLLWVINAELQSSANMEALEGENTIKRTLKTVQMIVISLNARRVHMGEEKRTCINALINQLGLIKGPVAEREK